MHPIISPIPIGTKTGKYNKETEERYVEYTPISIKIIVLLTPGTITPIDIINPDIIRYIKLKLVEEDVEIYFSRKTEVTPIKKAIKV